MTAAAPATRMGSVMGFMGGGNSNCSSSGSSVVAPFCSETLAASSPLSSVPETASSALLCLEVDVAGTVVGAAVVTLGAVGCDLSPELGSLKSLSRPLFFVDGGGSGGGGGTDLSLLWLSLRSGGGSHFRL